MNVDEIAAKYGHEMQNDGTIVPKSAQKQSYLKKMNERLEKAQALVRQLTKISRDMQKTNDLSVCRDLELKAYEIMKGL